MTWQKKVLERMKSILLKQERGAILVLTALLLPMLLGCIGIAYDVGTLYMHKARLQNMADAAALAGARAYLDSQKKVDEEDETEVLEPDNLDEFPSVGRTKVEYKLNDSNKTKDRSSSVHPKADIEADKYIYKNIINLGTKVKSDEYSHFALKDSKGNKFYRIGLEEKVPLVFLPVILDKFEQRVRAGATVLLEGGGTTIPTKYGLSLFDKLFVTRQKLNMFGTVLEHGPDEQAIGHESSIKSTFVGDIIFTGDEWNSNNYWIQGHKGSYLYSTEEAKYQVDNPGTTIKNMQEIPNTGSLLVHDNTIDIGFYVTQFKKKLNNLHIDYGTGGTFGVKSLNNLNLDSQPNTYVVTINKNGEDVKLYYRTKSGQDYYGCADAFINVAENTYYHLQKEKGMNIGGNYVENPTYVADGKGNRIFCINNNGNWNFYRETITYGEWDVSKSYEKISPSGPQVDSNTGTLKYSYSKDGKNYTFAIEKVQADFSNATTVKPNHNNNILHWDTNGSGNDFYIDDTLSGSETNPLYIIVESGAPKVYANVSNDRPVIYCYLGTQQFNLYIAKDVTFKGVIYTPYTLCEVQNQGNFSGNIIAKTINIQVPGNNFTQENYLKGDDILNIYPDGTAEIQQARKEAALSYAKTALSSIVPASAWDDPDWYTKKLSELEENKKQEWIDNLRKKWYEERLKLWENQGIYMPDWPWNEGGKTTDLDRPSYIPEENSVVQGDKTKGPRLINYNQEFTATNPFRELNLNENLD